MSAQEHKTSCLADFIPLGKLGTGSFSSVYKVRRVEDDTIYALKKMKLLSLKQKQIQNALNQIRILASINCENVIAYKEAFYQQKLNLLCLVMELANQGDLSKKIEEQKKKNILFNEQAIWSMAKDITKGLKTLHQHSILHRDIKSANIFISNGQYKLGDLNVSKIQQNAGKLAYTQTGTPNYASPEVWRDQAYDNKSDIWSLGCVIYQMCSFKPPFKGKDLDQLYQCVQRGYYEPISSKYSQKLKNFIAQCLKMKSFDRPSCDKLLQMIDVNSCNLQEKKRSNELIADIKVPIIMKELNKSLPKPRYQMSKKENTFFLKSPIFASNKQKIKSNFLNLEAQPPINSFQNLINPQNTPRKKKQHNINQNINQDKEITNEKVQKYLSLSKRPSHNILGEANSAKHIQIEPSKDAYSLKFLKLLPTELQKKGKVQLCLSQRKKYSNQQVDKIKDIVTDRLSIERGIYVSNQQKKYLKNIGSMNYISPGKIHGSPKSINLDENKDSAYISRKSEEQSKNKIQGANSGKNKLKKICSSPNISDLLGTEAKNMINRVEFKKQFSYLNRKPSVKKNMLIKR